MEYYVVSPNVFNDGINHSEEMFNLKIAAVGWDVDSPKGRQFDKIQVGDCIIVALRKSWQWSYFYLGIVSENVKKPILGTIEKKLTPIVDLKNIDLGFDGWSSNGSNQIPAIQRITEEIQNQLIINKIQTIIGMQKYIDILTSNRNLILTGAPGTGKTYLAKQIAQQLIFDEAKENFTDDEKKQFNEQCGFVQFHPSYDYTDFVEGLRPIQDDNGNVGFKRKDGMFKDFCKKALQYTSIDGVFDALIQDINSGKITTIPLKTQESSRLVVEENKIRWHETNNPTEIAGHSVSKENIKKLYNKYSTLDSLNSIFNIDDEIRQVIGPCNSSYYYGILRYIIEKIGKKFVFIIDEINRGEISKIFGELFFSIDPGYRGKNGKVKTQYQNLVEAGDEFYDGFYVPENVYIIGTMNDIDRSVESMDFAFRRRFAFKEIKADENLEMLEELGELKAQAIERMKRLNTEISKIEGLSSAYHIGAAYFLKLKNYRDDADGGFENLWNNHLEGLLREYLRGSLNIEENIAKLKAAYNNESPENNG